MYELEAYSNWVNKTRVDPRIKEIGPPLWKQHHMHMSVVSSPTMQHHWVPLPWLSLLVLEFWIPNTNMFLLWVKVSRKSNPECCQCHSCFLEASTQRNEILLQISWQNWKFARVSILIFISHAISSKTQFPRALIFHC